MEVKFIKASPTENMTLLIETPVAREKQLAVAERLIAYGSVYAEQAGYIEEAENPAAEKRLHKNDPQNDGGGILRQCQPFSGGMAGAEEKSADWRKNGNYA